jgi:two-component sensor histidine kinase
MRRAGPSRFLKGFLYAFSIAAAVGIPFLLTLLRYDLSASHAPEAAAGVLDLRGWDIGKNGPVPLVGEWTFFPGELLEPGAAAARTDGILRRVPDQWKGADAGGSGGLGAGTYRLRVLAKRGAEEPGLRWTTVSTSFEACADGLRIAGAGRPAREKEAAVPAYKPGVAPVPSGFLTDGELVLVVKVSNHEYRAGGMWRPLVIGPYERLLGSKRAIDYLNLLFLGVIAGIGLQHLVIYLYRPQARSSLYFFLFTSAIALRTIVTGEYLLTFFFPGIPFDLLIRLEYVSAYSTIPLGVYFFSIEFKHAPPRAVLWVLCPFLLLIPFAPLPILTRSILPYYPLSYLSVGYLVVMMVRGALRSRETGTLPILIGGLGVASAAVNDFLFSAFQVHTGNYISAAIVVFIHFMSISLSSRYVAAFAQIERLLAEKETYLKEMHHRVKNSLQIVASVMALQANRVVDPGAKSLFSRMRERVRSVALVHEKLNFSLTGDDVDIVDYTRDLVRQVASAHGGDSGDPELSFGSGLGAAQVEFCVDYGLVLTELLINAYLHAGGPTSVAVRRLDNVLAIEVRDAGPGFPEGFDERTGSSLGFKIVSSVVRRRGGEVRIRPGRGGAVELSIPIAGAGR